MPTTKVISIDDYKQFSQDSSLAEEYIEIPPILAENKSFEQPLKFESIILAQTVKSDLNFDSTKNKDYINIDNPI